MSAAPSVPTPCALCSARADSAQATTSQELCNEVAGLGARIDALDRKWSKHLVSIARSSAETSFYKLRSTTSVPLTVPSHRQSSSYIDIDDVAAGCIDIEKLAEALPLSSEVLTTQQLQEIMERFERNTVQQLSDHRTSLDNLAQGLDVLHKHVQRLPSKTDGQKDRTNDTSRPQILLQTQPTTEQRELRKSVEQLRHRTVDFAGTETAEPRKHQHAHLALGVETRRPLTADTPSGYAWRVKLATFVHGDAFNALASFVIVCNTVILGIQTNAEVITAIQEQQSAQPGWFRPVNAVFMALFMVELTLRAIAEQSRFLIGQNYVWNLFDACMVGAAFVEVVFDTGRSNVTFFRIIKLVRMFRAIRILRVFRYFGDLRLMVCSIMSSFVSLGWAFMLIIILIYCCSIMLCQGVATYFSSEGQISSKNKTKLDEFYGNIPSAMYTLILAISGGQDWYELVNPLSEVSKVCVVMFVAYTLFVIFGMLNVLTGVFVDRAMEIGHLDRDLVVESEKRRVEKFVNSLRSIFAEMDPDSIGCITWQDFQKYTERSDVIAYLAKMELAVDETKELFRMLDSQGLGTVDIDEFIYGCLRVKGQAKSLDVLHLQEDVRRVKRLLSLIVEKLSGL